MYVLDIVTVCSTARLVHIRTTVIHSLYILIHSKLHQYSFIHPTLQLED